MALLLSNVSPIPGDLDADPDLARWVRISALLEVDTNYLPLLYTFVGENPHTWHVIYNGITGLFSPLFAEHSTVQVAGQQYTFSLLPTGGWWASPVAISFGQYQEADL